MSDDDKSDDIPEFNFEGLDFGGILRELRNAAWLRAGAAYLGGAVYEYRNTLIENGMEKDDATMMTVETIRAIFSGFASAIPGTIQVSVQAAEMYREHQRRSGKQHKADPEQPS